jgi:hypothetical protein
MTGSSLHSDDIHVPGYHKLLSYVGKHDGIEKTEKEGAMGNKRGKKYGRNLGRNT